MTERTTNNTSIFTDDERTRLGLPPRHRPPDAGQWTRADLDALSRERRHAEIDAAREAGQLAALLGQPDQQTT